MTFYKKFPILIIVLLSLNFPALCQPSCTPSTTLKNIELSYQRITFLPQTFRFFYKLTISCGLSLPVINPLYISDPLNGSSTYAWQIDSLRNVTKVADPCLVFPNPPCYTVVFCHVDVDPRPGAFGFSASVEDCCLAADYKNLSYLNNISLIDDLPLAGARTQCTPNFDGPVYNSIINTIRFPHVSPNFINNSPRFLDEDTVLNICTSGTLSYGVRAVDPDGDSIAYHFSNPLNYLAKTAPGSASSSNYEIDIKLPFSKLNYIAPGYSSTSPLGQGVSLDPVSGLVKGSIPDTGTYLMTVSAVEFRNSALIDSVSKNFVVRVFNCSLLPKPTASIPLLINNCSSLTVNFPNNSSPLYPSLNFTNTTFLWNFGDGDTSSQIYPTHTYADTGTYPVKLVIFPGLRCADSTLSKAIVYPVVSAHFTYDDSCSDKIIHFTNTSVSASGPINYSSWNFVLGDDKNYTSSNYNTSYNFQTFNKTYPIILTVANNKGCIASDTQFVNIFRSPLPLAFYDTIISIGAPLQLFADDGYKGVKASFLWTPSADLSNPYIANPVVNSITGQTYYVTIKNNFNCTSKDSVKITYYKGPDIYVPNAFTPNGDGINDLFKPFQVGISKFYYFRVYNRWGQLMFETSQYYQGWDGKIKNGNDAPVGMYVWETSGIDYLGHPINKKGTVMLLR